MQGELAPAAALGWPLTRALIQSRPIRWLGFSVIFLLAEMTLLGAVYAATHPLQTDFSDAYTQARVVLTMGWAHAYDPVALEQQRQVIHPEVWYTQNYPPLLTLIVLPFATLPIGVASWLWAAFLIGILLACWHLVTPAGSLRHRLWWLLLAFALPSALHSMIWLALFGGAVLALAVAWRLDRAGFQWLAGGVLALAALKPQLAFLLPLALLAAGRWRTVVAGGLTLTSLGALALVVIGPPGMAQWLDNMRTGLSDPLADTVWPLMGLATLIPKPYVYGFMVAIAALVGAAAWRNRRSDVTIAYVIGLAGSQVAAPFIHPGDWVVTALAAALLLGHTAWRWRVEAGRASYVAGLAVFAAIGGPLAVVSLGWLLLLTLDPIRTPVAQTEVNEPAPGASMPGSLPAPP